jgi:hypothetical protein
MGIINYKEFSEEFEKFFNCEVDLPEIEIQKLDLFAEMEAQN